ncbi:hypothetical protein [Pseudoclavibacter sp. RFBA6]|uniref:ParB family protein n=1 Tax=Pseudoclavibacter sp. RFBA6 TaxID=2080573 RepID=UPI000D481783|nr:hypothetical protein [Pseudoclavibacter sp. RFBA6]PPG43754.1 hypothetical protein C5C17_00525 [Pseudoclavibacter sp. RFBA6]
MTRPAPRKSSLSGTTAAMPQQEQAAPAPAPTPAAPQPTQARATPRAKPAAKDRQQQNYYTYGDEGGRIRAAFFVGRDEFGWRNMTDMQRQGVMAIVEDLEARHNGGEPFEGLPPGTGPVGRPIE